MIDPVAMLVALVATVACVWLTGRFRRYALSRGLMDVPNARSSHVIPTPRGGGVPIVITVLVALPVLALLHRLSWPVALGWTSAGAIAAAVGYADDRRTVELLPRLGAHFACALCVLASIGAGSIGTVLRLPAAFAWLAPVIGAVYLVWMLNLTNFMDGIDGIAGVEVVTVCLGAIVCTVISTGGMNNSASAALLLAAATLGFLFWNWPPAKIFMGDAGSGFLGVSLGALSLVAGNEAPALLIAWLILAGVFIVDATLTLLFRVVRGETFYMAHRSHAYQQAAQQWTHKRVTTTVALINIVWLWPWALAAATGRVMPLVALLSAYVPLAVGAVILRAGRVPRSKLPA